MSELNSILHMSQKARIMGSPSSDERIEKMLGITYQYILLGCLAEDGMPVTSVKYISKHTYSLTIMGEEIIIDAEKYSSAKKVSNYCKRKLS